MFIWNEPFDYAQDEEKRELNLPIHFIRFAYSVAVTVLKYIEKADIQAVKAHLRLVSYKEMSSNTARNQSSRNLSGPFQYRELIDYR